MANTKDQKPAETEPTVDVNGNETEENGDVKRGRPATRQPGGKTLSAYFDPETYEHIVEAGFVKRHRTDSKLVHAAVLAYIKDVPKPEKSDSE